MENMGLKPSFWKNRKVLVTGHTGFKGSWLSLWLQKMEADVTGLALAPPTQPSLFELAQVEKNMSSIIGDIRNLESVRTLFEKLQPEIVIHMAAQSLVRHSYQNPVETYDTNVMGTLNILEGIRSVDSVRAVVMITTDKCYENKEWIWPYRENDPMGGYDPYSSSKGCAELLIASYRQSYFPTEKYKEHKTAIASARAGNVIGGGDWAEDRLIPDIISTLQQNKIPHIRNPAAIRPWQHVLEPLSGYMKLAEKLHQNGSEYSSAWNFGPNPDDTRPVQWIVEKMIQQWGGEVRWDKDDGIHPHEANHLKLDCSKAHTQLHWQPRWTLNKALEKIIAWHKAEISGMDLKQLCLEQIDEYTHTTN